MGTWTTCQVLENCGLDTYNSTPEVGQVLAWNGEAWRPATGPAPGVHAETHELGGGDEISVAGLSGVLADPQNAGQLQGRDVADDAPGDGDVLTWDESGDEWVPGIGGGVALHASTHETGGDDVLPHVSDFENPHSTSATQVGADPVGTADAVVGVHTALASGIHGVGSSSVESTAGSQGKVDVHSGTSTGIHGVGTSTVESSEGSASKVSAHGLLTTSVHGVSSGDIESTVGSAAKVSDHNTQATSVHGVSSGSVESTVGSAAKVSSHASEATGIHGVGASTIESDAGAASKVSSHASLSTAVHGVASGDIESTVGSASKVSTHAGVSTGIHGVGTSTVESSEGASSKVSSHASLPTGIHGVGTELLEDGDMEDTDCSEWTPYTATLSKETTNPHSGARLLRVAYNGATLAGALQNILTPGSTYRVRGFARSNGTRAPVVGDDSSTWWTGTTSTSWQEFNFSHEALAANYWLSHAGEITTGEYVEFDDCSIILESNYGSIECTGGSQFKVNTHATVATGIHGVGESTIESAAGAASKVSTHAALATSVHGVSSGNIESTVGSAAKVSDHAGVTTGIHGVGGSSIASAADISTHAGIATGIHGVGTSTIESSDGAAAKVWSHSALNTTVHGVAEGSFVESTDGAQARVNTHAGVSTGIHGVGESTVESAAGATSKVSTHASVATGVHGVGGSTIASAADISTHSGTSTGVHGVGASTVESVTGSQGKVDTHASVATGIHGVGGSTIASTSDISTHAGVATGVHGVGGSTVASASDISTHAGVATGVHGVGGSTVASASDISTHAGVATGVHGVGGSTVASAADISTHSAKTTLCHGIAEGSFIESTDGAQARVNTHSALTTGTHGVGVSTIASAADISTHAGVATGVHGVGGSTVASASDISTHSGTSTGVHGVGASSVESTSGSQAKVNTHEALATPHSGHLYIAGQIGGTVSSPYITGLRIGGSSYSYMTSGALDYGEVLRRSVSSSEVEGYKPSWGTELIVSIGNCDPDFWSFFLGSMNDTVADPSPSKITTSIARCVKFYPPYPITVNRVRLFPIATSTSVFAFAIYNAGTGSLVWDSDPQNFTAWTWRAISSGMPIALSAETEYWWCCSVVDASSGTAVFRTPSQPMDDEYWGTDDSPITRISSFPSFAQFAVTDGAFPSTLPTIAEATYVGSASEGTLPIAFLDNNTT